MRVEWRCFMSVAFTLLVLSGMLSKVPAYAAVTLPVIRILPDGSVTPSNAPIKRNGDIYTFTDHVYARIVVDRDNIIIDGAGYTLHGNYNGTRTDSWIVGQGLDQTSGENTIPWSIGIDLANKDRYNLTVRNLNIKSFYIGIYVWTTNNTIIDCAVTDCIVGILLSGDSNKIIRNYIARNEMGVFFGVNTPGDEPVNIMLYHNSFIDNKVHFSGCTCKEYNPNEPVHTWDNGKEGNYWDNYNGIDSDGDGIGDTPYIIDPQNQDRYPLMRGVAAPPTPASGISAAIVIAFTALTVIAAIVIAGYRRKVVKRRFIDVFHN